MKRYKTLRGRKKRADDQGRGTQQHDQLLQGETEGNLSPPDWSKGTENSMRLISPKSFFCVPPFQLCQSAMLCVQCIKWQFLSL